MSSQEKTTSFGSGFSQLFDSGFNQSIVYIHSFVKDSDNEKILSIILGTIHFYENDDLLL